jgi:uncharacterized membrane protein YebE (DUF533 family)
MNAEDILGGLIRGALEGRGGRKRHRRTDSALGSLVNAKNILAAAGLAWGIYEAHQQQKSAGGSPSSARPPLPPSAPPPVPPEPETEGGLSPAVLRLVRLTVSAARSDGQLGLEERGAILEKAREVGAESVVAQELTAPRPLAEIVAGATDPALKAQLYTLAFAIVRADESVSGAERIYLAQLAHQLSLDAATVASLEGRAEATIDATA